MLDKILNTKEYVIYSTDEIAKIRLRLENLFNKKESSVSGKFINPKSFSAHDSGVIVAWSMPYLSRQSAYLSGKILKNKDGGVDVKLSLRPNMILPIMAMAIILAGLVFVGISLQAESKHLIAGAILLVLGLSYYPISSYFRNRLRNKVVDCIS